MSNGHVCCLLGICCPPGSPAQTQSLAQEMVDAGLFPSAGAALPAAIWLMAHFDFAPAGTLGAYAQALVAEFKAHGQGV